ncbi:MAG: glycoside hydrolase family 99-like domain-containing protein [Hyphomicrobiales bacterium]
MHPAPATATLADLDAVASRGERLTIAPLQQLAIVCHAHETSFIASGHDPQGLVVTEDGRQWRPQAGRYLVHLEARVEQGALSEPSLYFDYGEGFSQSRCQGFERLDAGRWVLRLDLRFPATSVRFDPSCEPFTATALAIRVTSIEALLEPRGWRLDRPLVAFAKRFKLPRFGRKKKRLRAGALAAPAAVDSFRAEYATRLAAAGEPGPDYVTLRTGSVEAETDVQVVAFYLPQFHPIPENDAWWGRGFTEWTNVSKTVAQYEGHQQPKLPGELGFYDLRVPDVMRRQVELARQYGVHAFCFHYYWFSGKRLLEGPLDQFVTLADELAFPFCLCWANENWTRRWDGHEEDVLIRQSYTKADVEAVFEDLCRYITHPSYLRVDGCPVILVYRAGQIPNVRKVMQAWRKLARARGLPGLHLVLTNAFETLDPLEHGFDASCQFPPHGLAQHLSDHQAPLLNPQFQGRVVRYDRLVDGVIDAYRQIEKPRAPFYPGVMPQWDNTARRPKTSFVFHGATPGLYARWLQAAMGLTRHLNPADRRLVFVNAWNEWAEGTYLEPDRRFGYGWLEATASSLELWSDRSRALTELAIEATSGAERRSDTALFVHLFYEDLIEEFERRIKALGNVLRADVLLSIGPHWTPRSLTRAIEALSPTRIAVTENRGRDVLPFLKLLRQAYAMGYETGCKVHSKKSPHRVDGDAWRAQLLDGLLSTGSIDRLQQAFFAAPDVGLAAPQQSFVRRDDGAVYQWNLDNCRMLARRFGMDFEPADFVGGTMFWFRLEALRRLAQQQDLDGVFEPEFGQTDGTMAHAMERLFLPLVSHAGYRVLKFEIA